MQKTDRRLQLDVMEELRWNPVTSGLEVAVATQDGVVTLAGAVATYAQKMAAERAAESVEGVRAIADEIEIRLPSRFVRGDTEIAHAAVNALRWDVQVPDDRIRVKVQGGWLTLDGEVEWWYQKRAAEEAVRNLVGVVGVTNALAVMPQRVSPRDLRRKIRQALHRNVDVDARGIEVEVRGGTVRLTGRVRTWAERGDAEHAVWAAPGVTKVEDEITVGID
jgi:osmotically-inducible protein OsmY